MQRVFRVLTLSLILQKKSVLCWSLKKKHFDWEIEIVGSRTQYMIRNRFIGIHYRWMMVKKLMLKKRETERKIMKWRNTVQNIVQVLKILVVSSSYIEFSCVNLSNLSFLMPGRWTNHSTLSSGDQKKSRLATLQSNQAVSNRAP